MFPNCQYGGKLPKKARGLLWVELFVGPLCPVLGFGNFIPSLGATRFGGNGRNLNLSFSPSPNILNVFVSCLHRLLAVTVLLLSPVPHSPTPMNLWSHVAANWKRKPHIQSDLSLMWNSMLTWQSKWESQTISVFTLQDRQSDAPQTTTSCTLLIVYWWSPLVVFAFPNKYKHMSPFFYWFWTSPGRKHC